jgi:hypothetical protein
VRGRNGAQREPRRRHRKAPSMRDLPEPAQGCPPNLNSSPTAS